MHRVEQAVFASPDTDQRAGYRVVAQSNGIEDADARELAFWGPTHNSMLAFGPEAESFNFHPLPSGAFCVSHTVSTGWNRSAGRQRVATQCLIVPREVLARFGNNPFALLHAASAAGAWQVGDIQESTLEPLLLAGGAAPIDQALLGQLAVDPGPENVAALVQVAREAACLAIAGTPSPMQLIAGLFNCLPPECRLDFSFSTGLKFSPRRPFRIVPLSGDPAEQQWVAHYPNVVVLELHRDESPQGVLLDGWSHLIERTLCTGQVPFLAAQASKRRFHLTLDDLPALGLQLLEELDTTLLDDREHIDAAPWDEPLAPLEGQQQAHAAHQRFGKSAQAVPTATTSIPPPSRQLNPGSPEVLEKLEQLDDLVYEAISGHSELVEQLRVEWPKIMAQLGETLLSESREQYLRYALSIWDECTDADGIRNPTRATHALEVLCVLFGEAMS
jgi:hypothetical protein